MFYVTLLYVLKIKNKQDVKDIKGQRYWSKKCAKNKSVFRTNDGSINFSL